MAESYFIAKLFRQHRSMVMAVPKPVCIALGLAAGNHVVLQWNQGDGKFQFKKFEPVGAKDDTDSRDTGGADQGGQA